MATSSLELGIDMGAVDLVLQVESPKSVAARPAAHRPRRPRRRRAEPGRIFPKFRGDLLESAVVVRRMHEGLIEPTVVPRNALDVLAQQIVAIAVSAEAAGSEGAATATERGHERRGADELHELVRRTHSYASSRRSCWRTCSTCSTAATPPQEFGELRRADRLGPRWRARSARARARASWRSPNAGTIPDRGLYAVTLPDGRRVGELDEEMVYEARAGQTFLLGASTWRIEEIGRDRVIVTPAPGAPGAVPFWKGDSVGRDRRSSGAAIGAFSRLGGASRTRGTLRARVRPRRAGGAQPARVPATSSWRRRACCRATARSWSSASATRSATGACACCRPSAGASTRAWALALSARMRERFGVEADAISSDDGIVLHLPDLDADEAESLPSAAELLLLEPEEVERAVTGELGGSALFGARFRENASRALLIPRAYPGRRTPLWQQRLKAQSLLEVARRYADFPIVLETYRECLRDVLDVPGLQALLRDLHSREVSLVEVETRTASPFASSLLFDYVATYMYEGDTPTAERRAAALSLDRDLLRELLGPGGAARADRPRRAGARRGRPAAALGDDAARPARDELHDVLRQVGRPRRAPRSASGCSRASTPPACCAELERGAAGDPRCAWAARERYIAADEAGLYRDALGAAPPGGLPEAFLAPVEDALTQLVGPLRAHPRALHDRRAARALRRRRGRRCCASSSARERSCAASCAPAAASASGATWRSCGACAGPRWRPCARRSSPPRSGVWRPSCPPGRASTATPRAGAGVDRLREVLVPLQGLALPVESWERDVLPRRTGAYSPSWLDELCASGELVWVGAGPLGRSGRVALYFREDASAIGPPASRPARHHRPPESEHELLRAACGGGRASSRTCWSPATAPAEALREALWDLVWAGEVTNDAWAPLRAPRLTLARARAAWRPVRSGSAARRHARASARSRFGSRRRASGAQSQVQGRWSLTGRALRGGRGGPGRGRRAPPRARRTAARALRHRHPRAGPGGGHPRRLRGAVRHLQQARDARRVPARLLHRGHGRRPVRAPRARSSGCAREDARESTRW